MDEFELKDPSPNTDDWKTEKGIHKYSVLFLCLVGLFSASYLLTSLISFDTKKSEKVTTESSVTSDWKIYRNEEYGFELNYPTELEFVINNNEGTDFAGSFAIDDKYEVGKILALHFDINPKEEIITCDDTQLIKKINHNIEMTYINSCNQVHVYFQNKGNFWVFTNYDYPRDSFDQILSTFKFTK